MRNSSVSDRSFVMESDDDEDAVEAGARRDSDEESDGSSSCGSPRGPAATRLPSSYSSHQWPQSYRMSSVNGSWGGRKGRSHNDAAKKLTGARATTKQIPYGNSHLLGELNKFIGRFTQKQKEIARASGFAEFAKPVHVYQFDRQFTAWLMPRVDTMARSIMANGGKRIMMFHDDAGKVFGVPYVGKEVYDSSLDKSQAMRNEIQALIGMLDGTSAWEAASNTLDALVGRELTEEEVGKFKVSFLICVLRVLCDSTNPGDQESVNFWPALKNHADIHTFNWASYILDSVFSACASARLATRTNTPYSPPAGTAIFLQIFYLDNMDYGELSLPKSILPRIQLFDPRTLSRQIMAETVGLRGQTPCRQFGAGKCRPDADVIYRRNICRQPLSTLQGSRTNPEVVNQAPRSTVVLPAQPNTQKRSSPKQLQKRERPVQGETIQARGQTSSEIDISTQALLAVKSHKARCLKVLAVARKSLEEESDKLIETFSKLGIGRNKHSSLNVISILDDQQTEIQTSPGEPFTPSPTLPAPNGTEGEDRHGMLLSYAAPTFSLGPEFDDVVDRLQSKKKAPSYRAKNTVSPLGPSPPRKISRMSSPASPLAATKLKSGEYLFNKRASATINLNDIVAELEFTQSPVTKKIVIPGKIVTPPRDTSWPRSARKSQMAKEFHTWAMGLTGDPNKFWVRHGSPKFIEISETQIIDQFIEGNLFQPDTCDALLRRFQQASSQGWRHFLETDFAMRALSDEDYLSSRSIQHQFIGKHIHNDISKCMLFITIAIVENKWSSFAWDMKRRQITIHDASNQTGEWVAHEKVACILTAALRRCIAAFFQGWSVDWDKWTTIYTTSSCRSPSTTRSGYDFILEALQFCRTFDGVKQGGRLTSPKEDCPDHADLLFDMLHLKNNTATVPLQFVEDLDD